MAYGPFADAEAFGLWLKARAGITDPFSYVVIDKAGHACGIIALMAVRPEMRVIEVGNIVLSPALQRTALATEAQYLIARYVFETLNYRRYEWKCDARNAASRRAALRLGFNFEGLSWQHMIVKGRNRDTAWYAMLDTEWPVAEARLRALARARELRCRRPPEGQAVGRDPAEIAEDGGGQRLGKRRRASPAVARMKRSAIRERAPHSAALHAGYKSPGGTKVSSFGVGILGGKFGDLLEQHVHEQEQRLGLHDQEDAFIVGLVAEMLMHAGVLDDHARRPPPNRSAGRRARRAPCP